ncbi:skin secretory protein xP2-like [Amphibalanus amphitrite]|uniref:skin secretory protein xP2-like n=1 Tax=Amphibalanus amphitrite TaxID=1232801 RepID=UPI001C90094A|nr:skin secretory protein xP2-like [Amphibalanus amphitrite]
MVNVYDPYVSIPSKEGYCVQIFYKLTALLERQVKRAAEADKRLERLERLLTGEPSAGTDSASTCDDRAECSVPDSGSGAVSRRLEDFELTLKHAVNSASSTAVAGSRVTAADGAAVPGDPARGSPARSGQREQHERDAQRVKNGHLNSIGTRPTADRPVATSAATKVRDSPVVAPVTVAAGTAVLPPPADTGQAGHTALQPAELSDAADVHGACPPPAGGWPAQTMDGEAAPDNAVSSPQADTGRTGSTAAQPTEPVGATASYGASPPPAGGIPTWSTDRVYRASPPPAGGRSVATGAAVSLPSADTGRGAGPAGGHGPSRAYRGAVYGAGRSYWSVQSLAAAGGSLQTRTGDGNKTAGDAVLPPPADTDQPGGTAAQPAGPAGAAEAYGASPPPVGGIPTPSTGQGAAAGPAVSSPPADTGQIESTAGQSSRPADTHGASPPPAGGLQTLSTGPGAAAGPAVSPPPADTGQTDCSVTQPTVPGETDDAYGASPPLVGGPPTQRRDREEVVSDAVSPPEADMGQTDCAEDDACLAPLVGPVQWMAGDAAGCDPWPPPDTGAPPTGDLPGDNGRARCGRRNKRPPPWVAAVMCASPDRLLVRWGATSYEE